MTVTGAAVSLTLLPSESLASATSSLTSRPDLVCDILDVKQLSAYGRF